MTEYAIEARDVHKSFGGEPVVRGVDLRVPSGEIAVLMGPNGEGKTVLMCCLAGGLSPTRGDVLVHGRGAAEASEDLSLLSQGALALPELDARENVAFYSRLHPAGSGDADLLFDALDLEETDGKPLRDFSGGMARKVELAVALNADVSTYLLDEPTAELDPSAVAALHDVLASTRAAGRTIVMTSHSPVDARIADRLVFLAGGRVVANGPPDRLLENVPSVLRVRGAIHRARGRIEEFLVSGYGFERGDEVRGFLRERYDGNGIGPVGSALGDDCPIQVEEPSYADMFEYYTSVVPGRDQ